MSYSTSSPPRLLSQDIGNTKGAIWLLTGTDAAATVRVTGYITNGGDLGMKVNDIVQYTDTNLGIVSTMRAVTVSSTAPGAVDLSDATSIGVATNTD